MSWVYLYQNPLLIINTLNIIFSGFDIKDLPLNTFP